MGTPGKIANRNLTQNVYEFMRKHPGMVYYPKGLADELDISNEGSVGAALSRMVTIPEYGIVRSGIRGGYYYNGAPKDLAFNDRGHREPAKETPKEIATVEPAAVIPPAKPTNADANVYEYVAAIDETTDLLRDAEWQLYVAIPFADYMKGKR
jgi:hypothetical protein